jgi:RNA polymerase sigma-70 factor (ECF subfamily)
MENLDHIITDESLMLEIKNGDLDKASRLYDKYSKLLYNYFVKLSLDKDAGYDMMQDTFLTFRESGAFKTWIFQIARNVFRDYYRKHKMMISSSMDINMVGELQMNEEQSDQMHKSALLHRSMQKLPEDAREILVLSRYKDLKYQEIAEIMDLSVSHVKVKVFRAIKKLREYYFEMDKV